MNFSYPHPPDRSRRRARSRTAAAVLLGAALCLTASACSSTTSHASSPIQVDGGSSAPGGIRGDTLSPAVALTTSALDAVFDSSSGGTTTLRNLQKNHLMLLYFGYTHCPDVCPTTMADLGQALRTESPLIQARTQVVFITSDPARDTPDVMKAWLANFDPGLLLRFVGLTAPIKQIDSVASSVGVPLEPPVTEPDGTISVEHGAQTLAFVNDKASVLWLAGTTPADYAHDIVKLAPAGT